MLSKLIAKIATGRVWLSSATKRLNLGTVIDGSLAGTEGLALRKYEHALRDIDRLLNFCFWLVTALNSARVDNLMRLIFHRNNLVATAVIPYCRTWR